MGLKIPPSTLAPASSNTLAISELSLITAKFSGCMSNSQASKSDWKNDFL